MTETPADYEDVEIGKGGVSTSNASKKDATSTTLNQNDATPTSTTEASGQGGMR